MCTLLHRTSVPRQAKRDLSTTVEKQHTAGSMRIQWLNARNHDMQLAEGTLADVYLSKKLPNSWGGLGRWSAEAEVAKVSIIDN